MLLSQPAQLNGLSGHGAVDATFYERSAASRQYCNRTDYRFQKLKVMKLFDTQSQDVRDVHCSTTLDGVTPTYARRSPAF